MKNSKAASRYANSLLELSLEKGILEEIKADMSLIRSTTSESHELDLLLHSPIVKADKKQAILTSIFEKNVQELTMQFLRLVTAKRREDILIQICDAFASAYRDQKGIVQVEITSARVLSDAERKEIDSKFKASGMNNIELSERVDEKLIGGLRIRVGDRLMDASIFQKLNQLQKQVSKN